MFMRMIYDENLAAASYLIGCQRTGEAIVIDPERDVDRYIDMAKKEGLRITAAAETHIHADFVSGSRELAERTGCRVLVSGLGGPDWSYGWLDKKSGGGSYPHTLLKDGDRFSIGNIDFQVIHTPGHTPEHICFLVTDRGGGADAPLGIATGDFVFVGDLGRPDLLESAAGVKGMADSSARQLFKTVQRLEGLPDYVQVWPAHGAGSACGKALGAVPMSTVGYEKRFNPAIRAASDEGGFVKFILADQPEPPLYFARMKRINRDGPPLLGELPRPRVLDGAALKSIDTTRTAVVDTRPWASFKAGHIPGAMFHPYNNSFVTDVGSMVSENEDIVLIIEPAKLDAAIRDLVRVGLDRIVGWCEPAALESYKGMGGAMVTTEEVDIAEGRRRAESGQATLLDVRRASEFARGHIPGARNISHTRLASRLEELPKDKPVLVSCLSGGRSGRAAALLQRRGYTVTNLAGGFSAWEKAGAPITK